MRVVANELRRIQPLERVRTAAEHAVLLAVLAARSSQSLGFFERELEAVFVHAQAALLENFAGQVQRKTECVVQNKRARAVQHIASGFAVDRSLEPFDAILERA